MQARFLELLEGLPEEVMTALLEVAYERACLAINSTLAVRWLGAGGQLVIETDKFNFVGMTKKRQMFTKIQYSVLEAWREAFEILKEKPDDVSTGERDCVEEVP